MCVNIIYAYIIYAYNITHTHTHIYKVAMNLKESKVGTWE